MAEWEVIRLATTSNGVWTLESAQIIAGYLNGEVKMAYADLGIQTISVHYWYVNVDLDTTQTDVPLIVWDDAVYAFLGLSSGGYYNTGSFMLITLDETATYVCNIGGGDHGLGGTWNVLQGDGFVAFKQTSKTTLSDNARFVFDTAINLITGESVQAFIGDYSIVDINNGNVASSQAVSTNTISETDGTLYVEIIKMLTMDDASPKKFVYQADNTYSAVWDYDTGRDKNVLINGVKFNRMGASRIYIPTE